MLTMFECFIVFGISEIPWIDLIELILKNYSAVKFILYYCCINFKLCSYPGMHLDIFIV